MQVYIAANPKFGIAASQTQTPNAQLYWAGISWPQYQPEGPWEPNQVNTQQPYNYQIQNSRPTNYQTTGHATRPQNYQTQGHATRPQNYQTQNHATRPQNYQTQGHATRPQN